jgi:hypothetical protein
MNSSIEFSILQEAVEQALRDKEPQGMAGGWSASNGKGRVYKWAEFSLQGEKGVRDATSAQ